MNLRDLRYILTVAETRHFGKAAERCHVSQPTLSGQIRKLEEELEVAIFERANRAVEITPAGTAILNHARLALEQVEAIRQAALAHRDPLAGALRIGAIPTVSPYLMPRLLGPLKQHYPRLHLVLSEDITPVLLAQLAGHEIDAALLATPVDAAEFDSISLFDEPFWLACGPAHELARSATVTVESLREADLLLLTDGHCLTDQVLDLCQMTTRPAHGELADLRAASMETLLQLVAAGWGCTLVPALALHSGCLNGERITTRRLDHLPAARRRIVLALRRGFPRRRALEAFAALAGDCLPEGIDGLALPPST